MDTDCDESSSNRAKDEGYVDKIKIDNNLQLSASIDQVKNILRSRVKYFRKPKDKLTCNIPAFPTDYELAHLSSKSYSDINNHNDLNDDWILLTLASNTQRTNGYYGCAYFNELHQQIVIAHRGTQSVNALWNDVKGIVFSKFVSQMNSAITFTYKIIKLIMKFNRKGAYLKVSLTGHSLGGWLAQVTTFTAKYLTKDEHKNEQFTLLEDAQTGYHAHTVVFDSPGCKQMLENLRTEYIKYRYGDVNKIQISIDFLDITTYLSAPNRVNCLNVHLGKLYRIFPALSDLNDEDDISNGWGLTNLLRRGVKMLKLYVEPFYTLSTHNIDKIANCFDSQTGLVKKDGQGTLKVLEVLNWPIIELTLSGGIEYSRFFKWASRFNNYNPIDSQVDELYMSKCEIHYHTKEFDVKAIHWTVFCESELYFLHSVDYRRFIPAFESVLFTVDTDDNKLALQTAIQTLDSMQFQMDIDREVPLLDLNVKPVEFISFVKQFNHFYSHLNRVERSTKGYAIDLFTEIYKTESLEYLTPFRGNSLEFDVDSFNLTPFLTKENSQTLLHIEEETTVGVLKIYKIFELVKMGTKYGNGNSFFLDMKSILKVKLNFASIFGQIKEDYLIVIENNDSNPKAMGSLKEIFAKVKSNRKFKVILIVNRKNEAEWAEIVGDHEISHHQGIHLSDLSSDSRKQILNRELINLQGSRVSLAQIIPQVEALKSVKDLIKLASDIKCKLDVGSDYLRNSRFDVFAVSNISLEDFQTKFVPREQVSSYVGWDPNKVRFVVLDDDEQIEEIFWCYSHKFRIHWLCLEEDQLILKDSVWNWDGSNDQFIEIFFTKKFETQVQEVFSGCFVMVDVGHIDEFVESLCTEEFLTIVEQEFMDYSKNREDGDIVKILTTRLKKLMNQLRGCFVMEIKSDDFRRELIKKFLSEKLETLLQEVLRSCFVKEKDANCKYTRLLFIERFRTEVRKLLSDYFVIGTDNIFISSGEKRLLKPLISTEVLVRLGRQEEIKAGSRLPKLDETEHYYIGRSLTTTGKNITRKTLLSNVNDIFAIANTSVHEFREEVDLWHSGLVMDFKEWVSGQNVGKIKFIILDVVETENQFKTICEIRPNKNIHLLIRTVHLHSDKCYYHNSDYIDNHDDPYDVLFCDYNYCDYFHDYDFYDNVLVPYKFKYERSRMCWSENNVLGVDGPVVYKEAAKGQVNTRCLSIDDIRDSVVTVKGMPGMGKSTFFTHLALHKKELFPSLWVVVIKLNELFWESMPKVISSKVIPPKNDNSVLEFFGKNLKFESEFEKSLFEYCLRDEKVVLILDAFDEVSPKYDDQIFGLLETLQTEMKVKQLWLSSRPYALKDQRLNKAVYTLQGFNIEEQKKFFLKFWTKQLGININKYRGYVFSRALLYVLPSDCYSSRKESIAQFPIVLMLIAKLYEEDFKKFHNDKSVELHGIRSRKFAIHNLYKEAIDNIISLNYNAKCSIGPAKHRTQAFDITKNREVKRTMKKYRSLALVSCDLGSLITDNQGVKELVKDIDSGKEFVGIISGVVNGVPQFIHVTFADYFAALWLMEEMVETEDDERFRELCSGLLNLLNRQSLVVLSLLNSQLGSDHILMQKLTMYLQGNKDHFQLLSEISDNGYHNVIKLIVDADIDQDTTQIYKKCRRLLELEVEMENTNRVEDICLDIFGDTCDFTKIVIENHLLHKAAWTNASGKMTSFLLSKVTNESLHNVVNDIEYSDVGTALHVAVDNNRLEVAKVLLENEADVGLRDEDGNSALDDAIRLNNSEMVELLLYNWVIKLPLELVMSCEFIAGENVARIFIKYIENCFKRSDAGGSTNNSLITSMANCGHKSMCGDNLDRPVVNFTKFNIANCQLSEKPIIALIKSIADEYPSYLSLLFCSEISGGESLLHMAARLNFVVTAQLIFGLNADADVRNRDGVTALSVAAKYKSLAFVLWILFRNENVKNDIENFVYSKSQECTNDLFVEIIVKNISESYLLTKKFDGGDTMLHVAAQLDLVTLAKVIIDKDVDINVRNDDNHTPLSLACKNGCSDMTELLIKTGACVNDDQQSPLLWAIHSCSVKIVEILIENGADVNTKCPFPFANNNCVSSWTPMQLIVVGSERIYIDEHLATGIILMINGADLSTCLENFTFHFTRHSTDLIVLFVICGLDIYITNNEGVSVVTYLEEHWQSMDDNDRRILRSVCLFSKYSLPCKERNVNSEFENALKFEKYMKDESPEFYNLINACKTKNFKKIQHHLHNFISDKKFYYDESYDTYISDCLKFIQRSVSLLINKFDMTTIEIWSISDLKLLSTICDKCLAELDSLL